MLEKPILLGMSEKAVGDKQVLQIQEPFENNYTPTWTYPIH